MTTATDETTYHAETPPKMRALLERIRREGWRVRFHWGDTETGRDWMDCYHVTGTLGRSMGPQKVPILIHNRRSLGGPALLDHCIVKIRFSNKQDGGTLYVHPAYHRAPEGE